MKTKIAPYNFSISCVFLASGPGKFRNDYKLFCFAPMPCGGATLVPSQGLAYSLTIYDMIRAGYRRFTY